MKKIVLAFTVGCIVLSFVYADSLRVIANPPGRSYACMVADTISRIILFGGGLPWTIFMNDAWSLDLATEQWAPLYPSGTKPGPRFMASAVYYPDSNAMVLVGGRDNNTYFDEVWLLKLTPGAESWRLVSVGGTHPNPSRSSATCVWDRLNNRLIYCGGECSSGALNDVWQLNLNTWAWSHVSPTGTPPTARYEHSAVYDPVGQRMILFGGKSSSGTYYNDVWALFLNSGSEAWTSLSPTGIPPASRGRHFTTYDPEDNTMVIGFGYNYSGGFTFYNDAWVLGFNPLQWYRVLANGPVEGRRGSCAAYNWLNHQTVIFGGDVFNTPIPYGDTYSLLSDTLGIEELRPIQPFQGLGLRILGSPSQLPCRFIASVPTGSIAAVAIYDKTGRLIRSMADNVVESTGRQVFEWDGRDNSGRAVPAGTYFIKLETGTASYTEKIIVVR